MTAAKPVPPRPWSTVLAPAVLGVATAIEFLGALQGAYRLGLPDFTDSGPKLFALLVSHGLLASLPSPRCAGSN